MFRASRYLSGRSPPPGLVKAGARPGKLDVPTCVCACVRGRPRRSTDNAQPVCGPLRAASVGGCRGSPYSAYSPVVSTALGLPERLLVSLEPPCWTSVAYARLGHTRNIAPRRSATTQNRCIAFDSSFSVNSYVCFKLAHTYRTSGLIIVHLLCAKTFQLFI